MANNNDTQRIWVDNSFLDNDTTQPTKKSKGKSVWIWILSSILVLGLVVAGVITYQLKELPILDNITVAGVDVGGMTKEQAVELLICAVGLIT